jgi:hypothetical protein
MKEVHRMGLNLDALFEGFDIMAIVNTLVKLVTDLIGGFIPMA